MRFSRRSKGCLKLSNWREIKSRLLDFLKGRFVEAVLIKLLKTSGGFRAWLLSFVLEKAFEEIVEPIFNYSIRKGVLLYDKTHGKIIISKINKAKEEKSEKDYLDLINKL